MRNAKAYRKTPRWVWLSVAATAALILPGAGLEDSPATEPNDQESVLGQQLQQFDELNRRLGQQTSAPDTKNPANARQILEDFVAKWTAGRYDEARELTDPASGVGQQLREIEEIEGYKSLHIEGVLADDEAALAVTSPIKDDRGREGAIFIIAELQEGKWRVRDVDFETSDATVGEVGRFQREHPNAKPLPGKREVCSHQMRQIALAMHLYADKNRGVLPPAASHDANGEPLLSWRVHILPDVDEQALYDEFHLDEPWDSPHNRKLIGRMPAIFACPNQKTEKGKTCYLVPVGEETAFRPGDKEGVPFPEGILDGTVSTIVLLDVNDEHAVEWTKPEDLQYKPNENPISRLQGRHNGGFHAVFADASTRFFENDLDEEIFHAFITRNGAEIVQNGKLIR